MATCGRNRRTLVATTCCGRRRCSIWRTRGFISKSGPKSKSSGTHRMSLASEIWNWQEGERVYSRLTTNVGRERLLVRLRALGLLELVFTIHAYFGDRV